MHRQDRAGINNHYLFADWNPWADMWDDPGFRPRMLRQDKLSDE
jgi:hypothetical protein